MKLPGILARIVTLAALSALAGGCQSAQIEASNRQLQAQQAELETLNNEVAAMQAAQAPSAPPTAGSCDPGVSRAATLRGGELFAASDFSHALAYYQDALTACPQSASAELNLARTYEAMGQRADAIMHYRNAAKGGGEGGDAAADQARDALLRFGIK
jgi:tetratricopeptide (TPR) repeat protein